MGAGEELGRPLRVFKIALLLATVVINQGRGCALREPDIGPVFERVTALNSRPNDAGGDETIELTTAAQPRHCRRYKLRDNTPVGCDGNAVAGLDSPNVSTQVVLQVPNAGLHGSSIATCSHSKARVNRIESRSTIRSAAQQATNRCAADRKS